VIGNLYRENIYDPNTPDIKVPRRVIKGAPHLWTPNYLPPLPSRSEDGAGC